MNSSIRFADQVTHIKIVIVSLVTAIVVVVVGINARTVDADIPAVTKAGNPVSFSTKEVPTVR